MGYSPRQDVPSQKLSSGNCETQRSYDDYHILVNGTVLDEKLSSGR